MLLVVAAALLLGAAAITTAVFALPKAWQVATGPSKQAGREFAAHWMQSGPAGVLTPSDIDMRCFAAADRAATKGVDLDDGRHLAPGRIMRSQFGPACADTVRQHLGLHQ